MFQAKSSINDVSFTLNGVTYKFRMIYHPDNPCDKGMVEQFQLYGCCEPELLHVMQRVIKPGMFVIDGGANVGFFSVLMAKMVGDKGKVLAIEPGDNNLWKLEQNISLNKLKNVEIVRKPLWRAHEKVKFYFAMDPGTNTLGNNGGACKEYDSVTLADYPQADFIKLDIEGAEEAALLGAADKLQCQYIVAELNEQAMALLGASQERLREFMAEHHYETFLLHKSGALPTRVPSQTRIIPSMMNTNILFSSIYAVGEVWKEVAV